MRHTLARLNDLCRTGVAGKVFQTEGIAALPPADQSVIREKVETFDGFTKDNDPYGERDSGAFEHAGIKVFWKIDYYDHAMEYGSHDPSDPAVTTRVLTTMLASEIGADVWVREVGCFRGTGNAKHRPRQSPVRPVRDVRTC